MVKIQENQNRRSSQQKGFTLVEMLVAVSVLSLLLAATSGMIGQSIAARTTVNRSMDQSEALLVARALMANDFVQAVLQPTRDPFGSMYPFVFSGGDNVGNGTIIQMAVLAHIDPGGQQPRGRVQQVHYILDKGRLVRRSYIRMNPAPDTPVSEHVIFDNITSLHVTFRTGGVWQPGWQSVALPNGALPDAVSIDITTDDFGTMRHVFIIGGDT